MTATSRLVTNTISWTWYKWVSWRIILTTLLSWFYYSISTRWVWNSNRYRTGRIQCRIWRIFYCKSWCIGSQPCICIIYCFTPTCRIAISKIKISFYNSSGNWWLKRHWYSRWDCCWASSINRKCTFWYNPFTGLSTSWGIYFTFFSFFDYTISTNRICWWIITRCIIIQSIIFSISQSSSKIDLIICSSCIHFKNYS